MNNEVQLAITSERYGKNSGDRCWANGNGITQVAACAGYDVIMIDIKEEFTAKGLATIEKSCQVSFQRTHDSARIRQCNGKITTSTSRKDCRDVDLVIEAVPEILDLKLTIFKELDSICQPDCIGIKHIIYIDK